MNTCDAKDCKMECKNGCPNNTVCVCDEKILDRMENDTKYCSVFGSKDGVLVFCCDHRTAAGYLNKTIKVLEYLYTDETLCYLSYSYLELIIRLRLLFQRIFAHKRTTESSAGHLHRIKILRAIAKPLKGLIRPLNAYPLGDASHQEKVQTILNLGYVIIMNTVNNMVTIQNDIRINNTIRSIPRCSAWNRRLKNN
jgi:hypothetical protein